MVRLGCHFTQVYASVFGHCVSFSYIVGLFHLMDALGVHMKRTVTGKVWGLVLYGNFGVSMTRVCVLGVNVFGCATLVNY